MVLDVGKFRCLIHKDRYTVISNGTVEETCDIIHRLATTKILKDGFLVDKQIEDIYIWKIFLVLMGEC